MKINDRCILTSYFSKKNFMNNNQKYNEFISNAKDYEKLIKTIIEKNIKNDKEIMIKLVNKKVQSEYIEKLNNKNLFKTFKYSKNINNYKNKLYQIFKDYEPEKNENIINDLIKKIVFLENHYQNNIYFERYQHFFEKIKIKICNFDYSISNLIVVKFFNNLSKSFYNIRLNIISSQTKHIKDKFDIKELKKKLEDSYNEIKSKLQNKFELNKLEFENLVKKMMEDEDEQREKTLEFFNEKKIKFEKEINEEKNKFENIIKTEKYKLKEFYKINDKDLETIEIQDRDDVKIPKFLGFGAFSGLGAAGFLHYTTMNALMLFD